MKFKLMIETYSKAMLILYYKQRFPLKTFIKTEHQVTNENFMQNISYYNVFCFQVLQKECIGNKWIKI